MCQETSTLNTDEDNSDKWYGRFSLDIFLHKEETCAAEAWNGQFRTYNIEQGITFPELVGPRLSTRLKYLAGMRRQWIPWPLLGSLVGAASCKVRYTNSPGSPFDKVLP